MKRCTCHSSRSLKKVMPRCNSPLHLFIILTRFMHIFPFEKRAIFANSPDLFFNKLLYMTVPRAIRTDSWSLENHAASTDTRCPDKTVGTKPPSGSKLHILAVRSLDVLRKNLESLDHCKCVTSS